MERDLQVAGVEVLLAADLAADDTEATLETGGAAFPEANFQVQIGQEIIAVASRSGDTLSDLTRGVEGTSATPHNAGDFVKYVVGGQALRQAVTGGQVSETYDGDGSHQTFAADLELDADAGADAPDTAFLAPFMGNVLGAALTKARNYIFGLIGALSVTGSKASDLQVGAVAAIIMDGVTEADGAFVAIVDGSDPSSETGATAAYAARQNNAHPDSGFDYGLDLHDEGRGDMFSVPGEGLPLAIRKADIRGSNEVCYLNGDGVPVDYTDGSPPATGEGFAGPGSFYIDRTNGELYVNTGTKAHPAWTQKAGGGGSQPVQAVYDGNAVTIANNAAGALTFDTLSSGTPLLDITTPDAPTFLEAGTYAITGGYSASVALTSGGYCTGSISSNSASANMPSEHPDLVGTVVPLTLIAAAGDPCGLTIINKDGAASRDFALSGFIVVKLA